MAPWLLQGLRPDRMCRVTVWSRMGSSGEGGFLLRIARCEGESELKVTKT